MNTKLNNAKRNLRKLMAPAAGLAAGGLAATQQVVLAEAGAVAVSRVILTVGTKAIATPFATTTVAGAAVALNPVVAGVVVGAAVYAVAKKCLS
jgi:hypothetical protein